MKATTSRSECPISCTLDVVGDKWTLLIVRDLLFFGKNSFGEFLLSKENIARNILGDRLEWLVDKGFFVKEVAPSNKSKFLYYPTQKAVDLVPVLFELSNWSKKHTPTAVPNADVSAFRDPEGTAMIELRKRIRN